MCGTRELKGVREVGSNVVALERTLEGTTNNTLNLWIERILSTYRVMLVDWVCNYSPCLQPLVTSDEHSAIARSTPSPIGEC